MQEGGDVEDVEVVEERGATGGDKSVAVNIQEDAVKGLQEVGEVDSDDSKSMSNESS